MNLRIDREQIRLIIVTGLLIAFGLLEGWLFRVKSNLPTFSNIVLFAVVNLNVILLLLTVYLVLRSIVKLVFEKKRNVLGHKLRTRLVIVFVGLAVIPTLPLFGLATKFMSHSVNHWFSLRIEQSLLQAVGLGKAYLKHERSDLDVDCRGALDDLATSFGTESLAALQPEELARFIRKDRDISALFFLDSQGGIVWKHQFVKSQGFNSNRLAEQIRMEIQTPTEGHAIDLDSEEECVMAWCDVAEAGGKAPGKLVALRLLPEDITEKLSIISNGYQDFLQIRLINGPLKTSNLITFTSVTLLVVFAAIWLGFQLAKNITVPIQHLLSATQTIAEGNLDVQLKWEHQDEIGMLVSSFNGMVRDLRESREQLAGAYLELQNSHVEIESRRRYMEIVMKNIAAGVVSADASGVITTINKSAENILGFDAKQMLGRHYEELLKPAYLDIVESFVNAYRDNRQPYREQRVHVMLDNRPMVLLIKASIFLDEDGQCLGVVVVFDDLTDLEKAQRMAAWREVARRIAHEIKNPLTPIQLSAQRLRRKYSALLNSPEGAVLEECTEAITQQVDLMKHLVNEFTNFARLPRANPTPSDLTVLVEESLALFRQSHPEVAFSMERDGPFPILKLDRVQFQQVMTNLLENALHALDGEEKSVKVTLAYDPVLKIARLECADTGHGLSPEDKLRIFEPYFSTKEKGTGLGLAIVAGIVSDHNGFIRVRDNTPRGAVIVIELPG